MLIKRGHKTLELYLKNTVVFRRRPLEEDEMMKTA